MSRAPFRRTMGPGRVKPDRDAEIREEIELYLDLRTEELIESGMDPRQARMTAEKHFGDSATIARTLSHQARRRAVSRGMMTMMTGLGQDLTYTVRTFRRHPGFTLVAVMTLALALAGTTTIFSVVEAALLRALPFEQPESLVFLNGYHLVEGEVAVRGASFPEFRDWRSRSRTVAPMVAVGSFTVAATGDGSAERLSAEFVTEGYFELLGWPAARGRTFRPEEHAEPDAVPVAVVSHALWERHYALDPDVVGRDIVLNDRPLTIVGVMPPGFRGVNFDTDLWMPDAMISVAASAGLLESRGSRLLTVIGRLTAGADVGAAQSDLDAIALALQDDFPRDHEDRFAQLVDFRTGYLGTTGRLLWILLGAATTLLFIAAANVANLLLVRSHGRTREIVLRRALGAEGRRIAAQLMTESAVLAVAGGVAGMALSVWALRVVVPMIPAGVLPRYVEPGVSGEVFLFSFLALTIVGVLTGLVPAIATARMDLATRLREGARASAHGGRRLLRAQNVFVVTQIALALVLMVGAGLLTRSFRAQIAVDTGAEVDGVVAMRAQLPRSRYDTDETIWTLATEVQRAVANLPGVVHASVSSDLPFRSGSSGSYIFKEGGTAEDRIRFHRHSVTPGYFPTLGVRLTAGRFLTDDDVDGANGVIVITDAMARRVFPGESAVGKVMSLRPDGGDRVEVVGVVQDVRYRDVTTSLMADANSPDVFFSWWQIPSRSMEIAVRLAPGAEESTVMPLMRQAMAEVDPNLPVFQLNPIVDDWRGQTATPRFAAFLMTLFSSLAAVLACVGIYGVLAFTVGQRSQEIAIRRAIGASAGRVAGSVIGEGVALAAIGAVVGVVAAGAGSRLLGSFLYGVEPGDPLTFLSVGGSMIAVAVVAAVVPALRAMRRDPAEALVAD